MGGVMTDVARDVFEAHVAAQSERRNAAFADSPAVDQAEGILRADDGLTDERRAVLYDIYHDSQTPEALAKILQYHDLPNETKHLLFLAKQRTARPLGLVERTAAALHRVAQIDPKILEVAEAHPIATRALTDAANTKKK
jgi:hypothetical protein